MSLADILGNLGQEVSIKIKNAQENRQENRQARQDWWKERPTPVKDFLGNVQEKVGQTPAGEWWQNPSNPFYVDLNKGKDTSTTGDQPKLAPGVEEQVQGCYSRREEIEYYEANGMIYARCKPKPVTDVDDTTDNTGKKPPTCPDNQEWSTSLNMCIPKSGKSALGDPKDVTTIPDPLTDDSGYWDMLLDSDFEQEMKYWGVQEETINKVYDKGWSDLQQQLAASGHLIGTEMAEVYAMYTSDRELALRQAYNEIMYKGLDRHLEKIKTALDHFTNNKSLDLTYAIQRGQLDWAYFNSVLTANVQTNEQKISLIRAITEKAMAQSAMDTNWATMHINFITLAMQAGLDNDAAETMWKQMLAQQGVALDSSLM